MGRITKWRGNEVSEAVRRNVAAALGEFALRVEGNSKKQLRRGHGVLTGTLRRSIHVAEPGYNWGADDVEPANGTPELGGKTFAAVVNGKKITIQVGSGIRYALPVHQGHHSFEGYHFLTIGLEQTKKDLPVVLSRHQLK
jgi:hypothetical protein